MSRVTFRRVREAGAREDDAIKLTLFRDEPGRICGWFLGPPRFKTDGIDLPYLPKSQRTIASVAIVRALAAAGGVQVCIVDPDDLWEEAWQD